MRSIRTMNNFKRVGLRLLLCLFLCAASGCGSKSVENADPTISHEGLYVDGNVLRYADGENFVMRGINMAHCWYKGYDEVSLDAISATGANCVRVVCSDGERWDKDSEEELRKIIDAVISRGMVAILEVHDGTGDDSIETLEKIADYWVEMAAVFENTEDTVILNIANEWLGSYSAKKWKDGYCKVIPKLRNAGIKNVIMVDAGGWGQNGASVKSYGVDVFESDELKNTMFSIHMYGTAGKNERTITRNLSGVMDQNLCVCVGEFGYTHSDGDVDEDFLMDYCCSNNIGYLPWSWKGNSGGVEYLDLATEWDGSVLSGEWGERVINGPNGIRETSKKHEKNK